MNTNHKSSVSRPAFAAAFFSLLAAFSPSSAHSQTILDEWNTIKAPPPPALKPATIDDPKTTALLIMDVNNQTCTAQRRPRCAASLPHLQKLVGHARAKGMSILYTLSGTTTAADIIKDIGPATADTVLPSFGPDKFMGNDLKRFLRIRASKRSSRSAPRPTHRCFTPPAPPRSGATTSSCRSTPFPRISLIRSNTPWFT